MYRRHACAAACDSSSQLADEQISQPRRAGTTETTTPSSMARTERRRQARLCPRAVARGLCGLVSDERLPKTGNLLPPPPSKRAAHDSYSDTRCLLRASLADRALALFGSLAWARATSRIGITDRTGGLRGWCFACLRFSVSVERSRQRMGTQYAWTRSQCRLTRRQLTHLLARPPTGVHNDARLKNLGA